MALNRYTYTVSEILGNNGIDFESEANNAGAVLKARPIELFWSLCKDHYSRRIPT